MDLSIWLPVDDTVLPFSPAMAEAFRSMFGNMSRLDAIHVPGGDGGPGYFSETWFSAVREVAEIARSLHPQITVTCSANSFNSSSFAAFLDALAKPETQQWLDGLQIGKEEPLPLAAFMARVAKIHNPTPYYFLRVPDITHTVETGFPVPMWDYTWSSTHGREAINPAPIRFAEIIRMRANGSTPTAGYSAYSEGLNDDFNKQLWSALTMEPGLSADNLTRQYARTFFGAENEDSAARGLLGLEKNWVGKAVTSAAGKTLEAWQDVKVAAPNWRRDMHEFRATVDAYVQARETHELAGEAAARKALAGGKNGSVSKAIAVAIAALSHSSAFGSTQPQGRALLKQVFALRDALNRSADLCPDCPKGGAGTISSQALTLNVQSIDSPLSNAPWLQRELASIGALPTESAKLQAIDTLLLPHWPIDLPEGSSYNWVGSIEVADRPHLLMGEGVETDPMHYYTPLHGGSGCTGRHYQPGSAQTLACLASVPLRRMSKVGVSQGQKLQMRWESLDMQADYTLHLGFPGPLTHDAYGSELQHTCHFILDFY